MEYLRVMLKRPQYQYALSPSIITAHANASKNPKSMPQYHPQIVPKLPKQVLPNQLSLNAIDSQDESEHLVSMFLGDVEEEDGLPKAGTEKLICSSLKILIAVLEVAHILHLLISITLSISLNVILSLGFSLDGVLLGRASGSTLLGDLRRGDVCARTDYLFLLSARSSRCLSLLFGSRSRGLGTIVVESELLLNLAEADLGGVGIVVSGLGSNNLPVNL